MRMHSLEAMAELATTGNPVMKEVLDKRGETNPNVIEVNCCLIIIRPFYAFIAPVIVAAYK